MALIEASDLGQKFDGRHVLKDITLTIDKGDVLVLIGPSGAGKTTLVRLLDLLDSPTSGQICFDGVDVTRSHRQRLEARRRMAYVQQKPVVFSMSVYDNVACGLGWRHEKQEVIRQRVADALELVGMADCRRRDAKTLSGGETQRVAIARALVIEPEVLLLDEPTANLDPVSVSKVEDILAHVINEKRMTIVMATHDMSQGQRLAGRIGVLMNGELLQVGSPGEIFWAPRSRQVAEFVGVENILAGIITERDDNLVGINVTGNIVQAISDCAIGDKVDVMIRPEDITLSLARETSSARNVFRGAITRMTLLVPLVRIEVYCGFPLMGVLTTRSVQELGLNIGQQVNASFKATAVHVIKRRS